jgi:hypothetical protein
MSLKDLRGMKDFVHKSSLSVVYVSDDSDIANVHWDIGFWKKCAKMSFFIGIPLLGPIR